MFDIRSRQTSLKLKKYEKVFILGLGGIGSWVAFDVAMSGCADTIIIVDPDSVEDTNLNRTLFRFCDINHPKVDAVTELINERRLDVNIISHQEYTSEELCQKYVKIVQYCNYAIIDCRDQLFEDFFPLYRDSLCNMKLGYDGLEMTIHMDPHKNKLWNNDEMNTYAVTPSFIGPCQLLSAIALTRLVTDIKGDSLMGTMTFDSLQLLNLININYNNSEDD